MADQIESNIPDPIPLGHRVGFELIGDELGEDVRCALQEALDRGAIFPTGRYPLTIFQQALTASLRSIETHPQGKLFQEFLQKGPYYDGGEIPQEKREQFLADEKTAAAITFIYSFMVNCFKGTLAELLATRACVRLLNQLQQQGELPPETLLVVGDAVAVQRAKGKGVQKGADLYILIENGGTDRVSGVTVAGIGEVKSFKQSKSKLRHQLDQHVQRAKCGLRVKDVVYPSDRVTVGYGTETRVIRITVLPSDWKLPRSFRWEESENGRLLLVERGTPPEKDDQMVQMGDNQWLITLKWAREALEESAYQMTFWYMEKVGEVIYSKSLPKGWEDMTPAEAGQNAAKMMLYYAILRCRTVRESQRAIALYNSYGYGYAIGMNFKDKKGRRQMLWPKDLDEIVEMGKTKDGFEVG